MKSSYWIDSAPLRNFPPLHRDIETDVLVVGAGITGITTAYFLKKAGLKVALIEREHAALMDTGHTTAHLTYVTDNRLTELIKNFGNDHAQATWDAGADAIDQIEALVTKEGIDCEFSRVPGYLHAPIDGDWESEAEKLKEEATRARELGFDAEYLEKVPHFGLPGIRFANQAKFHPRKYLGRLREIFATDGSHVFDKSAAEEFDGEKRRAKVNGHWIQFDRVVMATNNPLVGLASMAEATLFQTKLSLYSSYVLGASVPAGSIPVALFWDTKDPYDYLRVDRHDGQDYIIFGGEDYKTGQVSDTEGCFERLAVKLGNIVPAARIEHRWSGQVIVTIDGLPYIGENAEGQFIATGFCGNGITFGTVSALMARDWATGAKNPWADLFAVDRKKIKGAAWDYLKENKDYPYYLIKDRLARAEADTVREIPPGTGMIVKSKAGKVAAYRDADGNVTKRSAICPHMGCVVRWNPAETTWDCPCHGSRFKPTGEVMAGPAEAPLKAI
jgi:glycine/D-amino acid oxidase-like deaminating enzyme/nitrite reductase/ring-hydroxylating ferredoxin subunit